MRSSEHDSKQEYRLRINESSTSLTTVFYQNKTVVDVSYQLVEAMPSDRMSSLDLRNSADKQTASSLVYFDENIEVGSLDDFAFRSDGGGGGGVEDQTYCECNDEVVTASDCLERSWHGITYCDGNFCGACSIVVVWNQNGTNQQVFNNSVVFLPNYL